MEPSLLPSTPAPHSVEELELLVGLGHSIPHFHRMSPAEQDALLRQLESYECHAQVVTLLEWRISRAVAGDATLFTDFLWLMRVQYMGLERFDQFVESAQKCVARTRIPFSMVRIHMAEDILGIENFQEHAPFFKAVLGSFVDVSQKVLLLERLALVYEKKLFLETEVEPVYRQILELDPLNAKARRFYKLWYMQALRWKDVAQQLEALIEGSKNPHERQRAAHELAQLYLYNLNQPREAREILLEYCANPQHDIHQTLVECLERLELYDELLETLKRACKAIRDPVELANLKLKAGLVCIKAQRTRDAIVLLRESIVENPHLLLSYEALISALIDSGESHEVVRTVEALGKVVALDASRKAIGDAAARAHRILA